MHLTYEPLLSCVALTDTTRVTKCTRCMTDIVANNKLIKRNVQSRFQEFQLLVTAVVSSKTD